MQKMQKKKEKRKEKRYPRRTLIKDPTMIGKHNFF